MIQDTLTQDTLTQETNYYHGIMKFLLISILSIGDNSSNICTDESGDLSCASDSVIRIKDIRYKKKQRSGIDNCNDCAGGGQVQNWDIHPTLFEYRLHQTCSRQIECSFNHKVEIPSPERHNVWYAQVEYDCIPTGLFHNICSYWEKTMELESVHILLGGIDSLPRSCSCLIENGNFGILVVDYRPYFNDLQCADSSVFVDGIKHFPCSDHIGFDESVYNTPINVTDISVNISVSIRQTLPQMFWVNVEGHPDVIVKCNPEVNGPSEQASWSTRTTPATTTQVTTRTSLPTEFVTDEQDSTLMAESTSSLSSNANVLEGTDSLVPAIVGGFMGLVSLVVVIALSTCLVRRRKLCKKSQTKSSENQYDTLRLENTTEKVYSKINAPSTKTMANDRKVSMPNSSSEQEIETDYVFSQPIDTGIDNADNEATEAVTSMQTQHTYSNEENVIDYEEPYRKPSV